MRNGERLAVFAKKKGCYAFFALTVLVTLYMDVYMARNIMDGEASGLLYRAFIMARENNLFTTEGLIYSNEIGIFGVSYYFAPFFKLFSSWTMVRVCGTAFMQALYTLSFLYLTKQLEIGKPARWFSASLLLLPFSTTYARMILYHLYYLPFLTYSFFLLGLLLRLLKAPRETPRKAVLPAVLFALLWVAVGMNGVRHLIILLAPLFVQYAVLVLLDLRHTNDLRGWLRTNDMRERNTLLRLLVLLMYSLVFFFIGYLLNVKYLIPYYSSVNVSEGTLLMPFVDADKLGWVLSVFLICIGFRNSALSAMSARSAALAFSLLSFGFIGWCSYHSGYRSKEETSLPRKWIYGSYLSMLLFTLFIFVFNWGVWAYENYFVPAVVIAFPILAMELDRLKDACLSCARRVLILLTCVAFLFQSGYTIYWLHHKNTSLLDIWSGINYHEVMITDCNQDCVDFMHIYGYTYGMLPYWFANTAIEMSDGDLVIAPYSINEETGHIELMDIPSRPTFTRAELPDTIIVFVQNDLREVFLESYPSAEYVHNGANFSGMEVATDLIIKQ